MLPKNRYILVAIGVVILISSIAAIYLLPYISPKYMIKSKLNIKLPSSSKILNYTYDNNGGYLYTKILVEEQSINDLKEQLDISFGRIRGQKFPECFEFRNVCEWWDLNKQNIEVSYYKSVSGKSTLFRDAPKSYNIWAFITKEENGQRYLYIAY